jgi:hypothetical protein
MEVLVTMTIQVTRRRSRTDIVLAAVRVYDDVEPPA